MEIGDQVQQRVAAMKSDPDLEGITFLIWFNQGDEIRKTLKDLTFTGLFGAMLAGARPRAWVMVALERGYERGCSPSTSATAG